MSANALAFKDKILSLAENIKLHLLQKFQQ